ncbi:MAG TPA: type II secretion system protein GspM [Syntrophales bacterium]|nr:type II secretion system protein GspM [Syntrophales bacterium]
MQSRRKLLLIAIPAIAILSLLVAYQYGYVPVQQELGSVTALRQSKQATLEKNLALIAKKADIESGLAAVKDTRRNDESKLIDGQTPSVAAATLQNTLKGMITARGGTISSERVEKPETLGKFKIISVTVDAVVPDTKVLGDVLLAIETQTPFLVIREMEARVRNYQAPRDLTVRLKVSGLTGGK